jgi:putative N6-adenine-specific DNA methylase
MDQEFEMIAKTFQGLENVLAEELTNLGANDIQIGRRMVSFTGNKEMMYRANFCLRTAIRILKPIKKFDASDADAVYEEIKAMKWEDLLDVDKTFAVDAVVFSEEFRHSKFVAYKVKDAIVDHFREKTDKRPSVRINNPDIQLNIHIAETHCTLSLDSSGESLHRRGYRQEAVEAPLNEVLAAGMILMTGWRGECDLIDPMCGSGTIPIEAGLIARNIAPGVFRKGYAFEKWPDFNEDLFQEIYNDDSQERDQICHIYGYDNSPYAITISTENVKAAGLTKNIELALRPIQQFEQPENKSIIITNPPYGERISSDDILQLYHVIGERFKHAFEGNEAWVLSYHKECFDEIGLKATEKIPLFNGALECEFHKYQIFGGKYNEYKEEHPEDETPHTDYKMMKQNKLNDYHRKSYGDSDKPKRPYDGDNSYKPKRVFGHDDFDRSRRSLGHDNFDRPRRSFGHGDSDRPQRSFGHGDSDRPQRSFGHGDSDRPQRSFGHGDSDRPQRSFGHGDSDRPQRSFGHGDSDKSRRSFGHGDSDKSRRSFGHGDSDKSRRSFGHDQKKSGEHTRRPRNATYTSHRSVNKNTNEE